MKIQSKVSLTSLMLILGLLFSSLLFFTRMYTVYQLKEYSGNMVRLNISMHRFIDRNLSLFTDIGSPLELTSLWFEDLVIFNSDMNRVLESPHSMRLGESFQQRNQFNVASRDKILLTIVEPLQFDLNRFTGSSLIREAGKDSLYILLQQKKTEDDRPAVKLLENIQDYMKTLSLFLNTFAYEMDTLKELADREVDDYIRESLLITMITVMIITLVILMVSLRFSGSLVRRITETNEHVKDIAQGRLRFDEREQDRDEFDELLRHYHMFSHVLSDRLDSLKNLLQDIGSSLGNETEIEQLRETIVELGMGSVGADSGMLFLADAQSESLELVQRTGFCPPPFSLDKKLTMNRSNVENYYETHPVDHNTAVFGAVMNSGTGLFIKDNEAERIFPYNSDSYEWLFISSLMALPLIVSNRLLGMLVFYKTRKGETFSDLDYTFFRAFTDYTAQSVDNVYKYRTLLENREIQKEIDVAAAIQKRLLPDVLPSFPSGSAEVYSLPARGISGDYFDAIRLDERRILYTVCDVAGKGVPASMLMIMIRTILHTISHNHKTANSLLRELNYHIAGRIGVDQYATMAVFILDTEKNEISYSNAAHHPLYLFRNEDKQFRSFDTEGLPIGIDKQSRFGHKRIKLNRGDYLFLFTDGLPEARNSKGEELSNEKLLRFLSLNAEHQPAELTRKLTEYLHRYTEDAKQHDDQTFLALRIS